MTRANRTTPLEAASTDLREVLTRLPAANVILSACPQGFTLAARITLVDPETLLIPIDLETFATPTVPDAESSDPVPASVATPGTEIPGSIRASVAVSPPVPAQPGAGHGISEPAAAQPAATAPPAEPVSPDEPPPGIAPISPAPGVPVPSTPDLPVPVSPAPGHQVPDGPMPVSPAPGHQVPGSPMPVSPAPGNPAPSDPAPGNPAPSDPAPGDPAPGDPAPGNPAPSDPTPGHPATDDPATGGFPSTGSGLGGDELPSGEALGAEIAAELSAQAQPAARRPEAGEWRGIVLVTGTDTDVGKTVVTAAVAAAAQASGLRVAVIKPGQTGTVTGAPTDIEVITRLAGPDTTRTLAEYPEPMAPLAAATVASLPPLELYEVVDAIRAEAEKHDLVLVEGAGGLLVPMGVRPSGESWTVADLATTLGISTIVVARAGLGTLNHTALTLEALARRGVPAGVVIGAWPGDPELVHWANLSELVPHLIGALPDGAGSMDPGVFRRSAPGWLTPSLYGVLDNWRVWAEESGEGHH